MNNLELLQPSLNDASSVLVENQIGQAHSYEEFLQPLVAYPSSLIIDDARSQTYTYQEFYQLVLGMAYDLEQHALEQNSIVVLYGYRNSFTTLLLFYACIKNNLIPFIVEYGNLDKIKDLKFNALLAPEPIVLEDYADVKEFEITNGNLYTHFNEEIYIGNDNDLAVVTSSGSTSKIPKKILLGKEQTLANIKSNCEALSIDQDDTTLIMLPISYSYGLIAQFLSHICSGADVVFADKSLGILQLPKLLTTHKITSIFMTPLLSRLILYYNKKLKFVENNLRFITIGGNKPQKEGLEKLHKVFQCPIYGTYGLAEAGPRVATNKFDINKDITLSLGKANPGITLQIIKDKKYQALCNTEDIGYMMIQTPSLYLGYIEGNTLIKPSVAFKLFTKDICVQRDGAFHILGRDDEYIHHDNTIIWFYDIGAVFYKDAQVLKVKVYKSDDDKLDIKVYHRNAIALEACKEALAEQFDLQDDKDYTVELIKFNNSQYK